MSISPEEYRDLLSFFSAESASSNIISLALTQLNESASAAAAVSVSSMTSEPSEFGVNNEDYSSASGAIVNLISDGVGGVGVGGNSSSGSNQSVADIPIGAAAAYIPRITADQPIWLIPCYVTILLFAIVGNLLVISTLVQNRRMRTITNLFLLNLAISDMLLGVLCMPVTLVGTLLRHFIFGEILCKLIQFSQATSVAVSSWTLVAISCERYFAICDPLRSRTWQTINHAYKIIGFIWLGSILTMTPIAVFSQLMPTSRQGLRKCREIWPGDSVERTYNILLVLLLLVVPLVMLCLAYILITRTLYVSMKNERAMIFGGSSSHKESSGGGGSGGDSLATVAIPSTSGGGGFHLNMSFRSHFARAGASGSIRSSSGGGGGGGAVEVVNGGGGGGAGGVGNNASNNNPDMETVYQQQQSHRQQRQLQRQHHQQQQQQQQQCYDDISQSSGSKRKLLTAADGRRGHLYCMRSSSVKSLNRGGVGVGIGIGVGGSNNNNGSGSSSSTLGGASPSPSMTVINVPQQQRFQLHQQRQQLLQQHQHPEADRRKSHSTPSLRITDAALRKSNETKNLESKKRVVKMLFVLVLEFFICWTPLYVINTLAMIIGNTFYEYIDYTTISFCHLLAYSSSCCNPITYCFMNAGFRRAFLDTFKGLHLRGGRFWRKRSKNGINLSVAGNSITMANSAISSNTILDSPRL